MKFMIIFILMAAVIPPVFAETIRGREVAYIEEVLVMPDGSRQIRRYPPRDAAVPVMIPGQDAEGATPYQPRQRGLSKVEQMEIDQLEMDFAHGKITESEYNSRKRAIYRSTFVDGYNGDDGLFNQHGTF